MGGKSLSWRYLRFPTQFGTRIALRECVNSEMNTTEASNSPIPAGFSGSITMSNSAVLTMRHDLHELANVFTGVMIAAGLLKQFLEAGSLQRYASNICESSERGSELVREIRRQLLTSCGDREIAATDKLSDLAQETIREVSRQAEVMG